MAHTHPELPYSSDALAPSISAETLSFHHGKHHAGYVKKLNAALDGTPAADLSLEELIRNIDQIPADKRGGVFNNAAQHFNHSFYWKSMSPSGGGAPSGSLGAAIDAAFGSFDAFRDAFTKAASTHFGSGWAWLVKRADGSLAVTSTHDADTPLAHGETPLLTCDVWEHAYYIDYRNNRGGYVEGWWKLVNWDFAQANYSK